MNRFPTVRQGTAIRIGAVLAGAIRLCGMLTVAAATVATWAVYSRHAVAGGPWLVIRLCLWASMMAFGGLSVAFVAIQMAVRCPNCGARLVPNPFARALRSFELHPSCGRVPGIDQWRRQADRIRRQGRCLCLRCGEDFDLARPPEDG